MKGGVWWASLLLCAGCWGVTPEEDPNPTPPENVMDRETFVRVFAETQLVESAYKLHYFGQDDPGKWVSQAYGEVFQRLGVSDSLFWQSHAWWYAHPAAMVGVLEETTEVLNQLERESGLSNGRLQSETSSPTPRVAVDSTRVRRSGGPKRVPKKGS